ncbi:MAG: LysR substrate-binding domain-containing protein [Burkholderiaceae bacterium]|nr:LysR substrate-binding domain-containing protein [Burkholderiaceae bacterium]
MTLTELKYIVALARERHFGRAADACYVSQPTLSVAVKKLEEELGVVLFERRANEVTLTPAGERIVAQASRVLAEAARIKELAQEGRDPLAGPLRVGVIYTIGPYLLPHLVPRLLQDVPSMPLLLYENFTTRLLEMVKAGEIDVAILALPLPEAGLMMQPLYDEPFVVAVPRGHPWAKRRGAQQGVRAEELKDQTMLLLGTGHCFRDQVLEVCPEMMRLSADAEGLQKTFEGSSLETIRHMVASGLGITLLPASSVPEKTPRGSLIEYVPFAPPPPDRRVVLVWRKSFPRQPAIEALRRAIVACPLHGVRMLEGPPQPL